MLFSVSFSPVFSFSFSLSRSSDKSDKDVNRNSPIVISRLTRRQFTIKPCCRQSKECVQNSTCWSNPFPPYKWPVKSTTFGFQSDRRVATRRRYLRECGSNLVDWRQGLNFWFCRTASTVAALVVANLSPRELRLREFSSSICAQSRSSEWPSNKPPRLWPLRSSRCI